MAPQRPAVPAVTAADQVRNPIDAFVLHALEARGLSLSPAADRATLIRRLSLDLIGLPPTVEEVDAFLTDRAPDAYERVVDRLLSSPHYGERQARRWLDLARYADTNGYEKDRERSMWPWRDWVIAAINADMPFDQFTVEQLAGDLLPSPTTEQIIATGFHRNTMLNQEGGIDVEEFRYEALIDRVGTTGTTWLGLTLACAQCHSHKYDPLTQDEFFSVLAFFDNTDEIDFVVPDADTEAARRAADVEIAAARDGLAARFPLPPITDWTTATPTTVSSAGGATMTVGDDSSIVVSGEAPERDTYTVEFATAAGDLAGVRLEAIADPEEGPGRTPHGNFVLTEFEAFVIEDGVEPRRVPLAHARAAFAQDDYPVTAAIDGKAKSGWGIHGGGDDWRVTRWAEFEAEQPFTMTPGARLRLVLHHEWGSQHTLGHWRIALGRRCGDVATLEAQRQANLEASCTKWLADQRGNARPWRTLVPERLVSAGLADFRLLADGSVLLFGNNPDRDTTVLTLATGGAPVTAFKIEALPHDSLPARGPGRSPFFPEGGFTLSDVRAAVVADGAPPRPLAIAAASATFEPADDPVAEAIDERPDTGWTNAGNVGRSQHAVFRLATPVTCGAGERIELTLCQHSIHNNNLGRFRVSVTDAAGDLPACALPPELEAMLAAGGPSTASEHAALRRCFLDVAPELAAAHATIAALEASKPKPVTTLVFEERGAERARVSHLRTRGEFLRRKHVVKPGVPAVLPPFPTGVRHDRLALARWLVDPQQPLVARVAVNRLWQGLFGRGLVATLGDFGTRGDAPTHPELLDWLATEFVDGGWSRKQMLRLMVTSATYRQSAAVSSMSATLDPDNRWLSRASRLRLDAELVRDLALRASGLLSTRIGGPSVFPPQPDGIDDLSYGQFDWRTSVGADRYRRGMYTFQKRTAPYPMFALFDGPSGETCIAQRERSDTPLQAMAALNDIVFVEAARGLGGTVAASAMASDAERATAVFRRCLSRLPQPDELTALLRFAERQRDRLQAGELHAATIVGAEGASIAAAVWTMVARAVLNLEETITRS